MSYSKISYLFSFLVIIGLVSSCKQDSEIFVPDPPERESTTTIVGQIVDEDNNPIAQVDVRSGVLLTQTDQNGVFRLESVRTKNSKAYVRAIKPGYHHASRLHFATDMVDNYVRIMMIDLENIGSFSASEGGTITTPEDVKLTFPADAIVSAGGANYSGMVQVQSTYLDPNDASFSEKMPGNLLGEDQSGIEQLLTSFGMISVELVGSSGQSLNVKDGSKVTIDAPVPAGLTPDNLNIPLWSFDETEGVWMEEGMASVNVDRIVGDVGHFSWWNFDVKSPMVLVCMQLLLDQGQSFISTEASNVCGCLTREAGLDGKQKVCGTTDENGRFKARVPIDEEMTLDIKDPCGNVIYTTTVGPYTEDTEEPPITIPESQTSSMIVSGTLVDCDNNRVANGYVVYTFDQGGRSIIDYVEDGIISDTILICDTEDFTVYGVDVDNIAQTTTGTYTTQTSVNVGDILACEEIVEFVKTNYSFMGESKDKLTTPVDQSVGIDPDRTIVGTETGQTDSLFFQLSLAFEAFTTGDFTEGDFFIQESIEEKFFRISCAELTSITVTSYGAVGEYIEGSFTADNCVIQEEREMEDGPVTGTFRVIREE